MQTAGERKTALVTGAGIGIGRGIALALAKSGYDLAITNLKEPDEAQEVARIVSEEFGGRCVVLQGDLTEEDTPRRFVQEAVGALGKLHVLVNNAGLTIRGHICEMSLEDMNYLLHLNFRAPLLLMQETAKHMIERGIQGSMINITSSRAERAYPMDAVYGGLKAGLKRAVESIALDLAPHKIRVNAIAPGATQVRPPSEHSEKLGAKIPLGRIGSVNDIGAAAVWLASEQASYITGVNLRVDGGLILPGMPEDVSPEAGYGWGRVK
jgi:glucose 1-dehydrogenase